MIILRYLLFPFSVLYRFVTSIRNFLFDAGILKSYSFTIPIIAVGNLSVGGTGKTPQIEYLIRLLTNNYKVATLSRGYKRKSSGFILANLTTTAEILGDEPYQMYKKFQDISVAVDVDRKNGIEQLISIEKPNVILLDDAFQHRKVKAGFYILLSSFDDLFYNDFVLPTGNLRESRSGAKRANMIIITKCPNNLSELTQQEIIHKIRVYNKKATVFFSGIAYDDKVFSNNSSKLVTEVKNEEKLLIAGIAKPAYFFDYLKNNNDEFLTFSDHHHFTHKDIDVIKQKATNKLIITTEKDYVRLQSYTLENLYYLPIKSKFLKNSDDFDNQILNYVGTSSRNR